MILRSFVLKKHTYSGKDLRFIYDPVEIDVAIDNEKGLVMVTAKDKYVHAVVISGNLIFDDNCFSLLPHESRTVSYRKLDSQLDECLSVAAYTLA